jgi:Kef-type K+ transport system membrane component KefB
VSLAIAAAVVAAAIAGSLAAGRGLARRGRLPVAGEMTAGLLLGAVLLSNRGLRSVAPIASNHMISDALRSSAGDVAFLGQVAVTLYLAAVASSLFERVPADIRQLAARWALAWCGISLAAGATVALAIPPGALRVVPLPEASYLLLAASIVSTSGLPIIARVLDERPSGDAVVRPLLLLTSGLITVFTFSALRGSELLHHDHLSDEDALVTTGTLAVTWVLLASAARRARAGGDRRLLWAAVIAALVSASVASERMFAVSVLGGLAVGAVSGRWLPLPVAKRRSIARGLGTFGLPVYYAAVGRKLSAVPVPSDAVILGGTVVGLTALGFATARMSLRFVSTPRALRSRLAQVAACRGIVIIIVGAEAQGAGLIAPRLQLALVAVGVLTTWLAGRPATDQAVDGSHRSSAGGPGAGGRGVAEVIATSS